MIGNYIWQLINKEEVCKEVLADVQGIIEISNVAEYVLSLPHHNFNYREDSICLIPPFRHTWFEFLLPEFMGKWANTYVGIEMLSKKGQNENTKEIMFGLLFNWFFQYESETSIFSKVRNSPAYGSYQIICDEWGRPILGNNKLDAVKIDYGQKINSDSWKDIEWNSTKDTCVSDRFLSCVLIAALNFIHCKNIKLTEINYNRKLVRHCKRTNKLYFEKYHVIDIERPKKILNTEGKAKEVGIKQAFHICRGHFKTYDKNNPLFGKLTGTYWWESYSRGDIKKGKISKDYKIKIK